MGIQIEWFAPKRGSASRNMSDSIIIRKNKGGSKDQHVIRISVKIMKACRFLIADKVKLGVGVDENGKRYLLIKRAPSSDGYTISSSKGKEGVGAADLIGIVKGDFSFLNVDDLEVPMESVIIDDHGLIIPLN